MNPETNREAPTVEDEPVANYSAPNNSAEVESDPTTAIDPRVVLTPAEQTMLEIYRTLPPFGQELARAVFDLVRKGPSRRALAEYIAAMPDTPDKAAWTPQFPAIIADWERAYDMCMVPEGGAE